LTLVFFSVGAVAIFKFDCKHFRVTRSMSTFLLLLALATSISTLFALFVVRPIYLPPDCSDVGEGDSLLDIHGKMLWSTLDFYFVCTIISLLSGTAIMCAFADACLISLVLFAESNPNYDEAGASKWQAA
ncbi:hypothetical protein EDC04DRAFT_2672268, partial [Pisolithus marmoratus]